MRMKNAAKRLYLNFSITLILSSLPFIHFCNKDTPYQINGDVPLPPVSLEINRLLSIPENTKILRDRAHTLGFSSTGDWFNATTAAISGNEILAVYRILYAKKEFVPPEVVDRRNAQIRKRLAWSRMFKRTGIVYTILGETRLYTEMQDSIPEYWNAAPFEGSGHANIVIYWISDYDCAYCRKSRSVINKLLKLYNGKIRIHHINFAESISKSDLSTLYIDTCTYKLYPDRFSAMLDRAYKDRAFYAVFNESEREAIRSCANSESTTQKLIEMERRLREFQRVGVAATPSFVIGNRLYRGFIDEKTWKKIIKSIN